MNVRVTRSDSNDIYLHYNEGGSKLTVRMSEDEAQDLMNDLLRVLNANGEGKFKEKGNVVSMSQYIKYLQGV